MTTVMLECQIDVAARLKVWRERWRFAPSGEAKAHAQAAIDYWLDRLLIGEPAGEAGIPPQRAVSGPADAING